MRKTQSESLLTRIQDEQVSWQQHNFPDRPSWVPLMGVGEELGELIDAVLPLDIHDAIGDTVIYLADYCTSQNINLSSTYLSIFDHKNTDSPLHSSRKLYFISPDKAIWIAYSQLCHAHIKEFQQIRLTENHVATRIKAIMSIMYQLDNIAIILGWTLEDIVFTVWERVKTRDWKKNPNSAHLDINQV